MGIKDLWTILSPFGERKPLFELRGKTVAIDLSCWVCEAQNIAEYYIQPQMYLRNLFFRTCYLLLLGVTPVYVLEGKAPYLKLGTIASRNAQQFKGKKPNNVNTKSCKDRTRFNHTLKLCEEMLKYMGLTCIKGKGEAEAMCAYLNAHKFVDGCITQDSDCFAYGATIVYKNFSISQQGLYSASGGALDEYNIEKIQSSNGIGRFKTVALALLCGSDYNDGVYGVGKDSALKLFSGISDTDILNRLKSWRTNSEHFKNLERQLATHNICTGCGHIGSLLVHEKSGCNSCELSQGCLLIKSLCKDQKQFVKNELSIRQKALVSPSFPDEQLINEYISNDESLKHFSADWQEPDIIKFIQFTKKHLNWEEIYAFEKFLMILSRWHLIKYNKDTNTYDENTQDILHPSYIKKKRIPKGTPSYEIIWSDKTGRLLCSIPPEQLQNTTVVQLLSTIEPQHLVEVAYPDLVAKYEAPKLKTKRVTKRKKESGSDQLKRIKTGMPEVCDSLNQLELNGSEKQPFKQTKINTYYQKTHKTSEETNLDYSNFGDENDFDLSDVLENILNYEQPKYITENLQKLDLGKCETSFFTVLSAEADIFEQSFTKLDLQTSSSDDDNSDICQ